MKQKNVAYKTLNISRSENFTEWLAFRSKSLSSTDATRLLSKKFDIDAFIVGKNKSSGNNYVNKYMDFGNKREPKILEMIAEKFDLTPNNNIMQNIKNEGFIATPDGIHEEYTVEVKSSINGLNHNIKKYYPQIQWQMFVTGKQSSLFIVEIHENFVPQTLEYTWVSYDNFLTTIFMERGEQFLQAIKNNNEKLKISPKKESIFSETLTLQADTNNKNTPDDIEW